VLGAFLPEWGGAIAALAALFALSYIQLRHIALAFVVVAAPLPGFVLAVALQAPNAALSYIFGFFPAIVLATRIAARVCEGTPANTAAKDELLRLLPLLIWPGLLGVLIAAIPLLAVFASATLMMAGAMALSFGFALAGVPFVARLLPYDGEFIARANRTREARERWLDRLAFVVQPRWGWSVSGIALIFAVLGYFGGMNSDASLPFQPFGLAVSAILFVTTAYLATRDLRRTVALCLTVLVLGCAGYWFCGPLATAESSLPLAVAIGSFPIFLMGAQSAAFARAGDNAAVATLRSSEVFAAAIVVFGVGAALVSLVLGPATDAILIPCGSVAALIAYPALTTMIYDLVPPRVSLDAYRVR
jgi:hypothetical protein